jgi:hypothetical protein
MIYILACIKEVVVWSNEALICSKDVSIASEQHYSQFTVFAMSNVIFFMYCEVWHRQIWLDESILTCRKYKSKMCSFNHDYIRGWKKHLQHVQQDVGGRGWKKHLQHVQQDVGGTWFQSYKYNSHLFD